MYFLSTTRAEGITRLMGEKGLVEEDWKQQTQLEEKHNIINKWAQEDVNTLYNNSE
jgi:hypothetical protein